jgi:hypothetical protein
MRTNESGERNRSVSPAQLAEEASHQSCSAVKFGACSAPEDVLSPLQLVGEGVNDGRRVYVHGASFDDLAMVGEEEAAFIYSALVSLPAIKLIHHDVVEEAVALQEFDRERADRLERAILEHWACRVTYALQRIGVRPRRGSASQPLIGAQERVVATCVDSSYYTFATTDNAARRMYADVLKLRKVRTLVMERSDAYRDLTMVRGKRLMFLEGDPLGRDEESRDTARISADAVERVKRIALSRFESDLREIIQSALSAPTLAESRRLNTFQARCITAVRRTILRLRFPAPL